ncbi:uncharacterized protein A4U43_UnF4420 [Asparagus officinalis]|uniref:Uncharacterized protein n=1 Tax=Asparagus officinalis TaxID=4686 RepID=A0A1R3L6W0_ASPOF|nr:uncharacterized protein A4U43_UnF4420 [Asparagus officinalis]
MAEVTVPISNQEAKEGRNLATPREQVNIVLLNEESLARIEEKGTELAIEELVAEEYAVKDSAAEVSADHEGDIWSLFAHHINEMSVVD